MERYMNCITRCLIGLFALVSANPSWADGDVAGPIIQIIAYTSSTSGKPVLRVNLAVPGPYPGQPACANYTASATFLIDVTTGGGQQLAGIAQLLFATGLPAHIHGNGTCSLGQGIPNLDGVVSETATAIYNQ